MNCANLRSNQYHAFMLLLVLTVLLGLGCSGNHDAAALPELSIDPPAEFEEGGTTWVRSEIDNAAQDCLARFFQAHHDLIGSPDMEGKPLLFTSNEADRRFYWLNATAEGSRWMCVQFEHRRYSAAEGNGSPF